MTLTDLRNGLIALAIAAVLALVVSSCNILPTVEPGVPTGVGTSLPKAVPTPTIPLVTVTGDVFVRDANGAAQGYIPKGSTVYAVCTGEWCNLDGGLKFWRGCSSDNPYKLGCTSK
jgi:hypothetical protein